MQVLSFINHVINRLTGMTSGRHALRNATLQNSQTLAMSEYAKDGVLSISSEG